MSNTPPSSPDHFSISDTCDIQPTALEKLPSSKDKFDITVINSISVLKNRKGSSKIAIIRYLKANYVVKLNENALNKRVKNSLKESVDSGLIVQTKGIGANGSFKVNKDIKIKVLQESAKFKRVLTISTSSTTSKNMVKDDTNKKQNKDTKINSKVNAKVNSKVNAKVNSKVNAKVDSESDDNNSDPVVKQIKKQSNKKSKNRKSIKQNKFVASIKEKTKKIKENKKESDKIKSVRNISKSKSKKV